jgi:hypothetical protein
MANEPFIYVDPVNGPFILLVSPDTSISRSLGLSNANVLTLDGQPIESASYALYAETSSVAISASHAIVSDTSSLARTALTASYVEFTNVANKPTLVSSSAQVLNGTGIYSSSAQLPPGLVSSSAQINTGSFTGSFTGVFVGNATASVFGTASWAQNASLARTASYVTFDNVANKPTLVSSSFQVLSGSGVYSSSAQIIFPTTSSYAIFAETASRATLADTASYVEFANVANKPTLVSSSAQINTGSFTGSFTGVFVGTASWATNAVTSQTASFVATASWSNRSTSASYADTARTASYVLNAQTASFVTTAQTASYVLNAQTASFVATASWARNAITASNASTASYVVSASYAVSASWSPASIDTYFAAYTNVTRSVSPSNTWITASFETDGDQASIWNLAGNNGSLTCSLSGVYEIAFSANAQKTGGGSAVASLRVLKNGAEMTGSFSSVSITVNNIVEEVRSEFNGFIESGSGLLFQYAGSNANVRFTGYQTSALPAYNYSMKLVINKN